MANEPATSYPFMYGRQLSAEGVERFILRNRVEERLNGANTAQFFIVGCVCFDELFLKLFGDLEVNDLGPSDYEVVILQRDMPETDFLQHAGFPEGVCINIYHLWRLLRSLGTGDNDPISGSRLYFAYVESGHAVHRVRIRYELDVYHVSIWPNDGQKETILRAETGVIVSRQHKIPRKMFPESWRPEESKY